MTRKALTFPDIRFQDEKLNRVVQHIRGLTQELQKLQAMLDDGAAGQVLTKIDREDYHAEWGDVGDGGADECLCEGENLGDGAEVFFGKTGGTFQFRTLIEGENINLVVTDETITISTPDGGIVQWDDIEGKPSTFPPSAHGHDAIEIVFDDAIASLGETEVQGAIEALAALIGAIAVTPTKDTRGASFVSNVALTTAVTPVPVYIPYNCTIESVVVTTNGGTGSVVVDIWKDVFANYPPDVTDTITAAAKPTIAGGVKYQDSTLTGWTTSLAAGDVLMFKLDSVSTFTGVFVQLILQPT